MQTTKLITMMILMTTRAFARSLTEAVDVSNELQEQFENYIQDYLTARNDVVMNMAELKLFILENFFGRDEIDRDEISMTIGDETAINRSKRYQSPEFTSSKNRTNSQQILHRLMRNYLVQNEKHRRPNFRNRSNSRYNLRQNVSKNIYLLPYRLDILTT